METDSPFRWLTHAALILALALVACRMLMSETIRSSVDPSAGTLAAPISPGAATGLALDLLFCVPALLVLCRRAVDRDFMLLGSWATIPMALLGALAALSPLWAADRFAAVVSAAHLCASLVLLWSALQVVRSWLSLRLVAGMCIGVLLCLSISGYLYRLLDVRELQQAWAQNQDHFRDKAFQERHLEPGSYAARQFEQRIFSGQPLGYSLSTNTYAALLVLLGLVTAGVTIQRMRQRDHAGWIVLPIVAIAAAIPLVRWTQCRAAYVTPVLGALILTIVALLGKRLSKWSRAAYVLSVGAIGALTFFVVRHGLRYGTLWHDSLNFRWNYWVGAWRVLTHGITYYPHRWFHFLGGVGWENFGPFYLNRRLPVAAEEIQDPHNFIVRVFVELGAIGGALLLAWMLWLWWDLTRPALPAEPPDPSGVEADRHRIGDRRTTARGNVDARKRHDSQSVPERRGQQTAMLTVGAIAVAAIGLNVLASIDFTTDGWAIFLELLRRALFLCALALGLTVGALRQPRERDPRLKAGEVDFELDRRAAPWVLYAILAALGTFLVHNLIEFSLFEPGPLGLFCLLAGSALGIRQQGRKEAREEQMLDRKGTGAEIASPESLARRRFLVPRIALSAAFVAWIAAVGFLFVPIAGAEALAHDADAHARAASASALDAQAEAQSAGARHVGNMSASNALPTILRNKAADEDLRAASLMRAAFARVPYNAAYMARAVEYAASAYALSPGRGGMDVQTIRQMMDASVAADPSSVGNLRSRAQFEYAIGDYAAARSDYQRALTLDPNNVRLRLEFAGRLKDLYFTRHRPEYAREAALEYERALDMNNLLAKAEIKRLTPAELAQVRKALSDLGENHPIAPSTTRPSDSRRDRMGVA